MGTKCVSEESTLRCQRGSPRVDKMHPEGIRGKILSGWNCMKLVASTEGENRDRQSWEDLK